MPVADILDLSEMEVLARVGELDRANLKEGQEVFITLDALADKRLKGTIKSMSGTATANIFSSDPAKKFEVVFSIDMEKLLSALGASKDQIARVMAQADANRKRAPAGGGPGGMMAGMMMMAGGGGGGFGGGGGGLGGPGGAGGAASGLTDEQRTKMREAMQKALNGRNMQDLTPEERSEVIAKVQEDLKKQGITMPGRPGGERKGGQAKGGEQAASGERRGGEGRRGGGQPPPGAGMPPGMMFGGGQQFNEKEMAAAKLPPPPEEDNQLDVLLRPGLLADVEIIVEKIPDAIHVPAQAVFQRDGKMVVFVKESGKFVPREIKLSKRSESTIVVSSGVKPGEEISLADPDAKPGEKGKKEAAPGGGGGGGAVGTMPGGKRG
jgi:Spy/CpxP family protein refolding chaperone